MVNILINSSLFILENLINMAIVVYIFETISSSSEFEIHFIRHPRLTAPGILCSPTVLCLNLFACG